MAGIMRGWRLVRLTRRQNHPKTEAGVNVRWEVEQAPRRSAVPCDVERARNGTQVAHRVFISLELDGGLSTRFSPGVRPRGVG